MGLNCFGRACGSCSCGEEESFIPQCLVRLEQKIGEGKTLRVSADHGLDKFYVSVLPKEAHCKREFDNAAGTILYLQQLELLGQDDPILSNAKEFINSNWSEMQERLTRKSN